jgi:lipoprotein signal peptidase
MIQIPTATVADTRLGLFRMAGLLALAVLLADIASKNWALAALGSDYIDLGLFALMVVENPGFAFSTGAGALGAATVLTLRLAALVGVLFLGWRFIGDSVRYAVGFALVVGGGLGNASDIVFRDGAVVDFISTQPIPALGGSDAMSAIVINLADVWILTGMALLYPLFRRIGRAAQRRFLAIESRVLGT